jgi:hypothetical protein
MFDCENEMCCYTCINGEYVKDNDLGYAVLCHKDGNYKEPSCVCLNFKDFDSKHNLAN